MHEDSTEILKEAILLERKGKAFYEGAARAAENDGVREVFLTMAGEERKHIELLERLYRDALSGKELEPLSLTEIPSRSTDVVLNEKTKAEIDAAGYEAAAISAAMGMEEKAVSFYSEQAKNSDGGAKELFAWLADWERTHLALLAALNEDLRQRVWQDQRFWPF